MIPAQRDARPRRALIVLLTVGLGCGAGLGMAEILVRGLLRYNSPDTVRGHSLQYLPSVFARHRLAPNQSVEAGGAWGDRGEGGGGERTFRVNERGYRGGPIVLPKPAGVVRIVVLGGSAVFDINATEGRDWPHLAQERLWRMGHREVEVINAGVPGHASFDSLGRLYSQIWMFEPDYVFVYHAWNDMKYLATLDPDRPLIAQVAVYDPASDPFQSYRGFLDQLLCSSQLYVKLRTQYFLRKLDPGLEGAREGKAARSGYGEWGLRQFRLNLRLLVDASRDIGATPLLATQATLVSANNGPGERARIGYEYQGMDPATLLRAFADCNRIIREVGVDKHVAVLDLDALLSGRSDLFQDHVHTTPLGSEAIAGATAEFLAQELGRGSR